MLRLCVRAIHGSIPSEKTSTRKRALRGPDLGDGAVLRRDGVEPEGGGRRDLHGLAHEGHGQHGRHLGERVLEGQAAERGILAPIAELSSHTLPCRNSKQRRWPWELFLCRPT